MERREIVLEQRLVRLALRQRWIGRGLLADPVDQEEDLHLDRLLAP
jgi:hypothetical protein